METLKKQIGERLRLRRESLGLTQGEIAKSLGVALTTIHRIEIGAVMPTVENLVDYCQLVGLSVDDVLGQPEIEHPVRLPSSREVVEIVKNALKVADNPLVQRILKLPENEQREIEERVALLEFRLSKSEKPTKVAKDRK